MTRTKVTALLVAVVGRPISARVKLLDWQEAERLAGETLALLTPAEKYDLINGVSWLHGQGIKRGHYVGTVPGIPRLGLPAMKMQDSGNGFRITEPEMTNTVTIWPSPLVAASSWDEAMAEAQSAAIAREFIAKGANVILGPAVNVHRVARGGRNFEYGSGEDPYLGARLARAFIRGVHGEGVMAVVKHWAFNEQETYRDSSSSNVDDRTAWESYYPPFEASVDEGAASFMCAYNRVNWTYSCENSDILMRDLRGVMGFRGFVMSDWGATHSVSLFKGLDMDMPGNDGIFSPDRLSKANQYDVYVAVRRILAAMYRLRLEGNVGCSPPDCIDAMSTDVRTQANRILARKVATDGIVLLKNKRGILPVGKDSNITTIAIVGHAADDPPAPWHPVGHGLPRGDYYSGGGSGHIHGEKVVTPLKGIKARAALAGIRVLESPTDDIPAALEVAMQADVVVVVSGTSSSESYDRGTLSLDGEADALIEAVSSVRETVVLVQVPGAILTPWRHGANVSAIACLALGGEETGNAWAAMLFGDVTPSGKLPITMPASQDDTIEPTFGMNVNYSEGVLTSYRSTTMKAAFPFGHGLSYTSFKYGPVDVRRESAAQLRFPRSRPPGRPGRVVACEDAHACLKVNVENVGDRPGREVVQVYLEFESYPDDPFSLRGFRKTRLLHPGESEDVIIALTKRDCTRYSVEGIWEIQDKVFVHIGASSVDIRHVVPLPRLSAPSGPSARSFVELLHLASTEPTTTTEAFSSSSVAAAAALAHTATAKSQTSSAATSAKPEEAANPKVSTSEVSSSGTPAASTSGGAITLPPTSRSTPEPSTVARPVRQGAPGVDRGAAAETGKGTPETRGETSVAVLETAVSSRPVVVPAVASELLGSHKMSRALPPTPPERITSDAGSSHGRPVEGPAPLSPKPPPEERNNWVLWLMQPLLLVLVVAGAVYLTKGPSLPQLLATESQRPREMWDAEDASPSSAQREVHGSSPSSGGIQESTTPLVADRLQLPPL